MSNEINEEPKKEVEAAAEEFETTATVEVTEEVAANPEALAAVEAAAAAALFESEPVGEVVPVSITVDEVAKEEAAVIAEVVEAAPDQIAAMAALLIEAEARGEYAPSKPAEEEPLTPPWCTP